MSTEQPASPVQVFQTTSYTDSSERVVEGHTLVTPGGFTFGPTQFFAVITGNVNSPAGPLQIPLKVPLEAADVHTAYAVFEATCRRDAPKMLQAMVDDMRRMQQRHQLAQAGKLQIPGGR